MCFREARTSDNKEDACFDGTWMDKLEGGGGGGGGGGMKYGKADTGRLANYV